MDGVIKTGMMPKVDNYFWLVCEKTPPYSATLYEFMPEDIAYCMDEYRYTLGMVARAKDANVWPSYSQRADNQYGIMREWKHRLVRYQTSHKRGNESI